MKTIPGESALIRRAQAGDSGAFDALHRMHRPQIEAVVTQRAYDRESVEDLVQTAFMKAYAGLGSFRGDSAFSTWLVRIALNVCRSEYRARQARPSLLMTEPEDLDARWESAGRSPVEDLERSERRRLVRNEIRSLPPNYRRAIWLRYIREWSYEEITRALKVPIGTVKTWLFRARQILERRLRRMGLQLTA